MRTVEQLLEESPALAGLPPEHRATMAGCARLQVFYPGERLLGEGDPADEFFLIRRGAVAVETEVPGRGAVTLETLEPGEILGWSWLVPPYRSAFGARALDAVHVVALDGACLRGKCAQDPALGFDLLKVIATVFVRRLEETRMRLLDLYSGARDAG
jgi:CRP/FNR family cyclic AMP-dependent transcriptional regulator